MSSSKDGNRKSLTPIVTSVEDVAATRWLVLQKIGYQDAEGRCRSWDRCIRNPGAPHLQAGSQQSAANQHHSETSDRPIPGKYAFNIDRPDAAAVLALLYNGAVHPTTKGRQYSIVLVKQFRPALETFSIEFPAGLVDAGENCTDAAIRELKEETGYTATKVVHVSPNLTISPGVGTESSVLVTVTVDVSRPENLSVRQALDDNEAIEVLHVPLAQFLETLKRLATEGNAVFDQLYGMAYTLNFLVPFLEATSDEKTK